MLNRMLITFMLVAFFASPVYSDPLINDITMPPASFTRVTDSDLLDKIGLSPIGAAWCYEDDANAILITAPARERAKCELKLTYELEKNKVKCNFELKKLQLRIDTLNERHKKINLIKDNEIERLTEIAKRVPNDHSVWWASGGFVAGALTTVLIVLAL